MTEAEIRASEMKKAWLRYAHECDRARIEYERQAEFWTMAQVNPVRGSAVWGWHAPTEKELARPRSYSGGGA